jgi:glutamate racemase
LYPRLLKEKDPQITVFDQACPLLCPIVEEGWMEDPITDSVIKRYISGLLDRDIDTLILGCTHYPLLMDAFRRLTGGGISLVNPAYETAMELKRMLAEKDLLNDQPPKLGENQYQFYVSDGAEKFKRFANSIIKYGILSAKTIPIENY